MVYWHKRLQFIDIHNAKQLWLREKNDLIEVCLLTSFDEDSTHWSSYSTFTECSYATSIESLFNVNILSCAAHLSASATLFIRNSGSVVGSAATCVSSCVSSSQSASLVPVTKSSTSCCSQLSVSCSLAGASVSALVNCFGKFLNSHGVSNVESLWCCCN